MKRKLLHMVVGTMLVVGCYGNVMATEIEETNEQSVEVNFSEEVYDEQVPQEQEEVSQGEQVVEYAKQFIGTPYVSGGANLNSGVDCSGFTQQVYKNFGVNLPHSSSAQYANSGYSVTREELQPGDLVFYGYSNVCHVAIYIGDDQVIHAPVPGKSVCIVPIHQRGDAPLVGYKRIF